MNVTNGMDAPTHKGHQCARVEVSSTTRIGRASAMQITTVGIDLGRVQAGRQAGADRERDAHVVWYTGGPIPARGQAVRKGFLGARGAEGLGRICTTATGEP